MRAGVAAAVHETRTASDARPVQTRCAALTHRSFHTQQSNVMAGEANDARLQYIQDLASSTLNISKDSLGPLLAREDVAVSLQQFFSGEGASFCCSAPV
jgi:hypothetical protein